MVRRERARHRDNQAAVRHDNTEGALQGSTAIVQVKLSQPNVKVTRGVVVSDNTTALYTPANVGGTFSAPAGSCKRFTGNITSGGLITSPINSNISNVDAGDLVTFAIVLENTGSTTPGAFDVQIADNLPAGFTLPAGGPNVCITDGTGSVINYNYQMARLQLVAHYLQVVQV